MQGLTPTAPLATLRSIPEGSRAPRRQPMKKTILIQTVLVVLALLLLIFIRLNQPPFEYIPTTIHLSDNGEMALTESNPRPREDPPADPEPEPAPAPEAEEVEVAPAQDDDNETEYQ